MSSLVLVRHGQASFMSDNYDQLSEVGIRQSRELGQYWASRSIPFDQAYVGPLRRHAQTAQAVAEAYADAGVPFPELTLEDGLREFKWDQLVVHALEGLQEEKARVTDLALAYTEAPREKKSTTFQRLFEEVCRLWVSESFAVPELERWIVFEQRVKNALSSITAAAPSKARIVAFTSGGPIAVACQAALDLRPEKALELIWTLRNGALAEFLFTKDRFSLSRFNEAPHLHDPAMWTYR